jgi:hypothetical protein
MHCEGRPARHADDLDPATLLQLWDRLGIVVRCGYHPFCACPLQRYLDIGEHLVESDILPAPRVQQRLLEVLIQTARDEALPDFWRAACVDHAAIPLGRLEESLACHDPISFHALRSALQSARDRVREALARRSDA